MEGNSSDQAVLGDEAPKTLSGFRAMKRADSERYNDLRYAMKVDAKRAIGAVDYTAKQWYDKHQEAKVALIALTAKDGLKVSGVAHHIAERILERKVTLPDIQQSLKTPYDISEVLTDKQGRRSKRYYGDACFTVLNAETGNAVTVVNKPRKGGT